MSSNPKLGAKPLLDSRQAPSRPNGFFLAASLACATAGLAHLGIILGGASWYRWFGAGEQMAEMATQGQLYPAMITLGIATLLLIWALYAWSAATGRLRLPFQRLALVLITVVFIGRGSVGGIVMALGSDPYLQELQARPLFILTSSVICLVIGCCFLLGLRQRWNELS